MQLNDPKVIRRPCGCAIRGKHRGACASGVSQAPKGEEEKRYECMAEGHKFRSADDIDEVKGQGCPECQTHAIIQR